MEQNLFKKLMGFTALSLAATAVSATETNTLDLTKLERLPVITDDCGGSGCSDRRGMSLEDMKSNLAAAAFGSAGNQAKGANNSKANNSKNGQGLNLGQMNTDTQVVYLNFEQSSPFFQAVVSGDTPWYFLSHQFTQAERDAIQQNLENDYTGFDIEFTQEQPNSGDFATLNFECQAEDGVCINFSGGILFGLAQGIDIGNQNRNDVAFVDASLWEVFAQLDPSGSLLSQFSGIEIENGDVQAALSKAVVNQASNTAAHELGHNLGLRHHDSFGSPGTGIPSTGVPSSDAFFPVFDGLQEGDEAILHTMASGASVGIGLSDSTARDRFFSERSVIKLASNQRGRTLSEETLRGKKVQLRKIVAPNTLLEGLNADGKLDIREASIVGQIEQLNEVDQYAFSAKAGDVISVELNGYDVTVGSPVIGALQLFFVGKDGSKTLVAQNFQNFEGFDAFLIDALIEKSGNYVLEVSAPNFISLGYQADGTPVLLDLEFYGYESLRTGDYRLSMYVVTGKPGQGVSHVPGA
ncbi:matrixin family metalloprotease [Pleionea sediminis]|uniref:matrixin family metalloprotease n=1 Tax=Pleionea sediminis TaxID=2569479 RepID=UPI001185C8CE|nr:matrixin family metalloprotease [Pleionea sediminis]